MEEKALVCPYCHKEQYTHGLDEISAFRCFTECEHCEKKFWYDVRVTRVYDSYTDESLEEELHKKYYLPTCNWNNFFGSADVVCIDKTERDRLAMEWNLDPVNDFREADSDEIEQYGVYDS